MPMVAPILYHSLVAKFQRSIEAYEVGWAGQGGGGGDTGIRTQLRKPVEDARGYREAAARRDRARRPGLEGLCTPLSQRAKEA